MRFLVLLFLLVASAMAACDLQARSAPTCRASSLQECGIDAAACRATFERFCTRPQRATSIADCLQQRCGSEPVCRRGLQKQCELHSSCENYANPQTGRVPSRASTVAPPDVFGTRALPMGRTTLEEKYASVNRAASRTGIWAPFLREAANLPLEGKIRAVNEYVNRALEYKIDLELYGVIDKWAGCQESLKLQNGVVRGQGDCEDYAICKMQLLRALGVPSWTMFLNLNKDTAVGADHATLVVRGEGSTFYCLELETSVLQDANVVSFYKPIVSYTTLADGKIQGYVHGLQVGAGETVRDVRQRQNREYFDRLRRDEPTSSLDRILAQQGVPARRQ